MSIVTRPEAFHLTVTELRVEDYFLMRTEKLKREEERFIKDAISASSFNPTLLDQQIARNLKEPISAKEKEIPF